MNTATDPRDAITPPATTRFDSRVVRLLIVMSMTFALLPPGFNWGNTDPSGSYVEGSWIFQLEFGSLFAIGAMLAWRNRYWSWLHIRNLNPFLILMIAYCALTMLWSPYPVVTLKRVIQMAGLTLVGIAISSPIGGHKQLIRTMLGTLMVLMAISFVVSLAIPSVGVDYELGAAWRGIMTQKNTLGAICGLCFVFWLKESLDTTYPRAMCYVGMAFSFFMLIMAKSSTSILVAVLGSSIYMALRKRYFTGEFEGRRFVLVLAIIVMSALLVFHTFESRFPTIDELMTPVTSAFGKSNDLTGRTDIWRLVLLEINRHPIFGIGYGAFWLGEGSPSQSIIEILHWIPLQAHNGYLDILNELGVVGLCIMVLVFLFHMVSLVRLTTFDREEAAIHWAMLILILISNLSESEIFRGVLFQNMFFLYSSATISARITMHKMAQNRETEVLRKREAEERQAQWNNQYGETKAMGDGNR